MKSFTLFPVLDSFLSLAAAVHPKYDATGTSRPPMSWSSAEASGKILFWCGRRYCFEEAGQEAGIIDTVQLI